MREPTIANIQATIRFNFSIVSEAAMNAEVDEISAEQALSIISPVLASTRALCVILKNTEIKNPDDARLAKTARGDAAEIEQIFRQIELIQ
jgi:hypothetical protein